MNPSLIKNMTERELLIQQAETLKKLCRDLSELKTENKKQHATIFDKIDKVMGNKVSNWLFFPIITLIVLSLIGLTGYVGAMKSEVVKNTTCVERIEKTIDKQYGGN